LAIPKKNHWETALLPLNSGRWLAGDIVGNPGYAGNFVDNTVGDFFHRQEYGESLADFMINISSPKFFDKYGVGFTQ
tara:strand:+ start:126 stop:356 length:231 start_codon:yes stop_codon:yes gene_type:complete